ncbi:MULTISPECIES: hypothetical protein [unclassified Prochlorococcus]|uniref:hypothetical protein n=1 Tax=Prochlorococcus sp. MIT 0701 TaxID=1499502 RepID=UPI00187CA12C
MSWLSWQASCYVTGPCAVSRGWPALSKRWDQCPAGHDRRLTPSGAGGFREPGQCRDQSPCPLHGP